MGFEHYSAHWFQVGRVRYASNHPVPGEGPEGATVDEVANATGWQRHTVRGVFSGTLKKKLGLTIASAKEERGFAGGESHERTRLRNSPNSLLAGKEQGILTV